MFRNAGILAVVLAVPAGPSAAQVMQAEIPVEAIACNSELIVVGQVLQAGEPAELELALPGRDKPLKGWFRAYIVQITQVIKDTAEEKGKDEGAAGAAEAKGQGSATQSAATRAAAGAEIALLAGCRPPRGERQIGGPGERRGRFPVLAAKSRYVLLLRKLPGRAEYYLPAEAECCRRAVPAEIARIERAADVPGWPWGEAVEGLRIALVPTRTVVPYQEQRIVGSGGPGAAGPTIRRIGGAQLQMLVALHNASDQPITVSLYKWDEFLSLRAVGPDGTALEHDFYKYYRSGRQEPFAAQYLHPVRPGQVLFIGPEGPSQHEIAVSMPLTPGTWRVQAVYGCRREVGEKDEAKPWVGKIESAPAAVEVRKGPTPARLPRAGIRAGGSGR